MKKLTGSAEEALRVELGRYKRFIEKRSLFYADLDDSNVIDESYIQKAAKEYNSNYYVSNSNGRITPLDIVMIIFSSTFLTFGILCIIRYPLPIIVEYSADNTHFFDFVTVLFFIVSLVFFMMPFLRQKRHKNSEKERNIFKFLSKWYEVEYVLQDMYEKKYEKSAGNIKDLLLFYLDLPEVRNSPQATAIFSLLDYRNRIIHKKTDKVDMNSIDSSIKELDGILDMLKDIEVSRKKNESLKDSPREEE